MSKIFESEGAKADITRQLQELREKDIQIEKKRKLWGRISLVDFLLAVASLGGFMGTEAQAFIGLLAVFVVLFVISIIIYLVFRAKDYDNRKLLLAMDVMNFLGRDIPKKASCALDVSFANYLKHGTLLSKEGGGLFNRITVKLYEDTWFELRGKLYDGNSFELSITQLIKRKEKNKGKKGTKVKEKIREDVELSMKVNPGIYGGIENVTNSVTKGADAAGLLIRKVAYEQGKLKVSGRSRTVMGGTGYGDNSDELVQADTVFQFLFYVYNALRDCRQAA